MKKAVILDNDLFVSKNLENLVKKYAHKEIIICGGKVFTGEDALLRARKEFPRLVPMLFPVPGPEDFAHIL